MPTNSFGHHDCEARYQPRQEEWTCSECGVTWFGSSSNLGFLWETAEQRDVRLSPPEEPDIQQNVPDYVLREDYNGLGVQP